MNNLLGAELRHMRKNALFQRALVIMLVSGVLLCFFSYMMELRDNPEPVVGEQLLYMMLPMIGFASVFWVSLFLGRELDFGTIRNKLIAGHTRREVYFALTLTCMTGCVLLTGALLAGSMAVSGLVMDTWRFSAAKNGYLILCTLLTGAVYGALYSGITLNSSNRAVAVCLCIGTMLVMIYTVSLFHSRLAEPEMWMENYELINGRPVGELVPNPYYVSGVKRSVYEFLYDFLPAGPNVSLNNMMVDRCERWAVLSVLMLPVVAVPGYWGFRRKDLR